MKEARTTLNGTWRIVYQEFEGREILPDKFEGQKLVLNENTYVHIAPKGDDGFIKVNDQNLDIYGTDGEWTICYNLYGGTYPLASKLKVLEITSFPCSLDQNK